MIQALITLIDTNDNKFFMGAADENVTHLKRKCYAVANSILFASTNIKSINVALSTGEIRDFVKEAELTQEEKDNAVLEWYKP